MQKTRIKKRPEKVLLVAAFEAYTVPSIAESVRAILRLSQFEVTFVNLVELQRSSIVSVIELSGYDALVIHNTVAFDVENLKKFDQILRPCMSEYQGVKIILKQDEHFKFREFTQFASKADFDFLFSVMPESEVPKTYGIYLPTVQVRSMLTGYVDQSAKAARQFWGGRSIDIGYRGSIMPLSYGRLCYQKRKIGDEVQRRLEGQGIKLDISSLWKDRLGAGDWFRFLTTCRAVLGVESGTDIFDLDGALAGECRAIELDLGKDDGTDSYAEAYLKRLDHLIGQISYFAISPRHFEAIAAGSVQILFPGHYSGRLVPGRHYFELAKDYSNLDDAIELIRDERRRMVMAEAAFHDVLLDPRNSVDAFVADLDDAIMSGLDKKGRQTKREHRSGKAAKNVLILQAAKYGLDPRRDNWYADGAPAGMMIHHLGVSDASREDIVFVGKHGETIINVPRLKWGTSRSLDSLISICGDDIAASISLRELYLIAHVLHQDSDAFCAIMGSAPYSRRIAEFRESLQYILDSALTLADAGARIRDAHAIVAINLPSLLPALVLKALLGVPVIYEALEYWPEVDPAQEEFEEKFWRELESRLVRLVEDRGTVTPQLASFMRGRYGVEFYSVPNCIPFEHDLDRGLAKPQVPTAEPQKLVRFLFQGAFSPFRGLELLIGAWGKANPRAILILRGPDNQFKQEIVKLAQATGLMEKTIFFLPPVSTDDLISSAVNDGDVGLVPYEPKGTNYSNCSPNKLGQYFSASLPILANNTHFVREVVCAANCGIVVDFSRELELLHAVDQMCNDEFRTHCKANSREYFEKVFNWQQVSRPFYQALENRLSVVSIAKFSYVHAAPREAAELAESAVINQVYDRGGAWTGFFRSFWGYLPIEVRLRVRPYAIKIIRIFLAR